MSAVRQFANGLGPAVGKLKKGRYIPTTPPTVLDTPETVLPRIPVTVLAAPVTPLSELLFILTVGGDGVN